MVVGTAFVLAGCTPKDQIDVVRDPASGAPVVIVGVCEGERVDAVRVRQSEDEAGPVVWEVQRGGTDDVRQVTLGSVPAGFATIVAPTGQLPTAGWAEVVLNGGGSSGSGSRYDDASLPTISQARIDELNSNAEANCSQVPFRAPWWLSALACGVTPSLIVLFVRRAAIAPRRPVPRAALASPWAFLSAVVGLVVLVVLGLVEFGSRNAPGTYVVYAAALSVSALGLGLLGRVARRARWIEWFIVLPGLVLALITGLVASLVGGMFASCGPEWTFDCTTGIADRIVVLGMFIPAWLASVWIAEGGWWPRVLPSSDTTDDSLKNPSSPTTAVQAPARTE